MRVGRFRAPQAIWMVDSLIGLVKKIHRLPGSQLKFANYNQAAVSILVSRRTRRNLEFLTGRQSVELMYSQWVNFKID